jgi:hypothetical protein
LKKGRTLVPVTGGGQTRRKDNHNRPEHSGGTEEHLGLQRSACTFAQRANPHFHRASWSDNDRHRQEAPDQYGLGKIL